MPSTREVVAQVADPVPSVSNPVLPGRTLLAASRRLLLICLGSGFVYSCIGNASHGGTGVPHGSGPAVSIQLTLHPSPVIYLAIGLIYFLAVHRVLSRATNDAHAARIFRRAELVVLIVVAASIVIALVWFFSMPLEGWPQPGTWIAPFPFATQDVVIGH